MVGLLGIVSWLISFRDFTAESEGPEKAFPRVLTTRDASSQPATASRNRKDFSHWKLAAIKQRIEAAAAWQDVAARHTCPQRD